MFDGVQLVRGRVATLARKLPLGIVGARAAGDVDVAAAQVTASLQGRRGRAAAVYDDARREEVRVLRGNRASQGLKRSYGRLSEDRRTGDERHQAAIFPEIQSLVHTVPFYLKNFSTDESLTRSY